MNTLDKVALVLVIIGALNWLLFAFGANLVEMISFGQTWLSMTVYILVGVSGLYSIKLLTE
jgi:hypothetical protein